MKLRGFTIIELTIALSIVLLLSGLGIPRITASYRRVQIATAARAIAECVQEAQSDAAAPRQDTNSAGAAHSEVILANNVGSITCQRNLYTSGTQRTIDTLIPGSQMNRTIQELNVCGVYASGASQTALFPARAKLSFSVLGSGLPENLSTTGASPEYALSPVGGSGMSVIFTLYEVNSGEDCSTLRTSNYEALITVPRLGTPVSVTIVGG